MQKKSITNMPRASGVSLNIRPRPPKLDQLKEETLPALASTKSYTARHERETKVCRIPRNVNFYRHLINDKYASENDIEWVLKLRSTPDDGRVFKMEPTSTQVFSFDGRGIEAQKSGRTVMDLDTKNHLHQAPHLFLNRIGPTPSQGCVYFETGLRNYGVESENLRKLERNWSNVPKKDRNEYPSMYPSYNETMKMKSWSTKNLNIPKHTGFEGDLNLPKYGELCERQTKNVSEIRHLLIGPAKLMPAIDWQLSMRHYGDKTKPREFYEYENRLKTQGQVKRVNRKVKEI